MFRLIGALTIGAGMLFAPTVQAADLAVLISNEDHIYYPRFPGAQRVSGLKKNFEAQGFNVLRLSNLNADNLEASLSKLSKRMSDADRIVVVTGGYVVSSDRDSWLLTADADRPSSLTVGQQGVSLGAVLDVLATRQGEAMLAIGMNQSKVDLGGTLTKGINVQDIPQGVSVVVGRPVTIARFMRDTVLEPGAGLRDGVDAYGDELASFGYMPHRSAFLTEAAEPVTPPVSPEEALWRRAETENTVDGYQLYLDLYPTGTFAGQAKAKIDDLTLTPIDRARIAEEGLRLSRDVRRQIQRNLTLIGYDTRGIDGLLGRNSRTAIARWQGDNGIPKTGYLNPNQISRIEASAAVRAEQLRREAEERRREEERRDRAFWDQTGANGSEDGLRAYLNRYPDGLYSSIAQDRLSAIERQRRREVAKAEREAWDRAVMTGTIASYSEYLTLYPSGKFAAEAKARLKSLQNPETPADVIQAARKEEAALNLNPLTRNLVEQRLAKLNFDPGKIDGKFTKETRRALRRFQRSSEMPVTGYVTKLVIVRMLSQLPQR